jgi:hypothetical protein
MTSNVQRLMVGALAASVLWTGGVAAQERGVSLPPAVREAQGVLIAAYPELREGRIAWRIESTPTGSVVEARRAVPPLEASANQTTPLVAATVTVDEEGRLQALDASGTLIERVRQQRPRAGRSRAADTDLRALGARFPPEDLEAAEGLVPPGLQQQLGARTRRETSFRTEGTVDAPQDALTWRVELDTDGTVPHRYTLVFEPVEGRLLSVVRR